MKAAKEEFLAVAKLLNRSSINSIPNNVFARNLSTSLQLFEKQQPSDGKEKSDDANKEQAQKSSSNDSKPNDQQNKRPNRSDNEKKKKEKNKEKKKIDAEDRMNNTEKALAYVTKMILWTCLIYSVMFTMYVISSIVRGDSVGRTGDINNYIVSWKEFVQYMLAAGEVKEIIVRPQYDYVRIVLHDGAVINGRRPRFTSYMLSVSNVEQFEQRLRQVEKSMGINDGKQIPSESKIHTSIPFLMSLFDQFQGYPSGMSVSPRCT